MAQAYDLADQWKSDGRPPILQRYIIRAIAEGEYETSPGKKQPEKVHKYLQTHLYFAMLIYCCIQVLSVQSEVTKLSKVIMLRQAWLDTAYTTNSYVHLVGDFDRYGQCIVDNTQNLLILHPDHLISATVVGDSFTCTRKAVLGDRVKATSDTSQATLYGHMLHEIFQEALRANRWDDEWMTSITERVATHHLEGLFELNVEHAVAMNQLMARVVNLQAWAEIFIAAKPKVRMLRIILGYLTDEFLAKCRDQGTQWSTVFYMRQQAFRSRGESLVTNVWSER